MVAGVSGTSMLEVRGGGGEEGSVGGGTNGVEGT
jgi:hypothetical protein